MPPSFDHKTVLPRAVLDVVNDWRRLFEQIIQDALKTSDTAGTCLYASLMLVELLNKFMHAQAIVRGGGPPLDGGVLGPDGVLRGHYWVELEVSGARFVVDVTADQFGYEPVVILPIEEARNRYTPGNQANVDAAVSKELKGLRFGATSL